MSIISVRQAAFSDLAALAVLFDRYSQFYGCASDVHAAREFLSARFHHGESVLFIALEGDQPVGFTQLYPSFSSVSMARIFVLNDLFVDALARRKGGGFEAPVCGCCICHRRGRRPRFVINGSDQHNSTSALSICRLEAE